MKSIKIILFLIAISFSFTNTMHAQFLKKLKSRVQQAAEEVVIDKVAEKGAQKVGKTMDSLLDIDPNYQAKNQEQLLNYYIQSSMQSGENIKVADSYNFDTNVLMEMVIEDKKNPAKLDYNMWFTQNDPYMATEINNMESMQSENQKISGGMLTVIDDENQAMIIIMEEQKMAQIISMESIKDIAIEETKNEDIPIPKITKTGKSKKILGYNCEEFITITEEGSMTLWITQGIRLFQKNMFANFNKSMRSDPFQNIPESAKGFMMEMHLVSDKGQKSSMYVRSISKKTKTINMKDYQLMNLSSFMKTK